MIVNNTVSSLLQPTCATDGDMLCPAANITLTFSYPVYLPALQQALEVVSCCGSNAGANQRVKVMPCGPPFVIVDPFGTPEEQVPC